jgi:alpha-methylacyl-CoA racemase
MGLGDANLPDQMDQEQWPRMRLKFSDIFATKTRQEWSEIMEGSDACFAPVLSFAEAPHHPHNKGRGSFIELDGVLQPAPSPRFSRTVPIVGKPPPEFGADSETALRAWSIPDTKIRWLMDNEVIGWAAPSGEKANK